MRAAITTDVTAKSLRKVLFSNVAAWATLHTDGANVYKRLAWYFADHRTVNHDANEYARWESRRPGGPRELTTTNSIEGFFGIFRRSVYGTWHSVSPCHLPTYLGAATFRYNHRRDDDGEQVRQAVLSAYGKHLPSPQSQARRRRLAAAGS